MIYLVDTNVALRASDKASSLYPECDGAVVTQVLNYNVSHFARFPGVIR